MIGKNFGHYRIVEQIGAGGMGVVYRATDTRLGRDVALKVLPDACSHDPDRMARFEREARLLASLNHPGIASMYGLEESGEACAIAMELVDGPTLADRLRAGAVPLEEALPVAAQIAEALEAAHEKGIIHRDLKPANVKVTPDDRVKLLDFGLAKALCESAGAGDLAASPTISEIASRTGVILGTAAYMSPEQARGKPLDRRTDVWSYGCVLYEMLTGKTTFGGETVSDTMVRILEREPDWQALPARTPPEVRRVLRRCLMKDPRRRLRDMGDARSEIEEALAAPVSGSLEAAPAPVVTRPVWWRSPMPWLFMLVAAVAAGFVVWNLKQEPSPAPGPVMRFGIALPRSEQLAGTDFPSVALSPRGAHIAYIATRGSVSQLFLRSMNSTEAQPVEGAEQALCPFFSPDGQWVGFFMGGKLMKVSVNGGAPVALCNAPTGFGAVWGPDNMITFAPTAGSGLSQVSADGGALRQVTTLDSKSGEFSHRWPELLPDGKTVLFCIGTAGSWDEAQIVAQALDSGKRYPLVSGGVSPHYVPPGYLVYTHAGTLMAAPFDAAQRKVTGPAVEVMQNIWETADGAAQLSISPLGHLVYAPGGLPGSKHALVWVSRKGAVEPLAAPPDAYAGPRLSPDGRRLAVTITQNSDNIWIYDIPTGKFTQLTFEGDNSMPVWTPDGAHLTFTSNRTGPMNLFWKRPEGGADERLATSESMQAAHTWSRDGNVLVFVENRPATGRDIWMLPSDGTPKPVLQSLSNEDGPALSPDARWLAYVSDESGSDEVYIVSFPGSQGKRQISAGGGDEPLWNHEGNEIFYRNGDRMMAVRVATTPSFKAGAPQLLFEGTYDKGGFSRPDYDVTADGMRFLMIRAGDTEAAPPGFQFVLSWSEELKRRIPRQ